MSKIGPKSLVTHSGQNAVFMGGDAFLLKDEFTTDDAAPLTSPRTCEPGPGTITAVETDGTLAISSGKLQIGAQSTPAWGDLGIYGTSTIARQAGRMLICDVTVDTAGILNICYWGKNASVDYTQMTSRGLHVNAGVAYLLNAAGSGPQIATVSNGVTYQWALILRTAGMCILIKGGAFTEWELLYVVDDDTDTNLRPAYAAYDTAHSIDNFRVPTQLWEPTTIINQSLASGATVDTGEADTTGTWEVTDTSGTQQGWIRKADATNGWYWEQNATDFEIIELVSGTPTTRATSSHAHPGAAYTVHACCKDEEITCFTDEANRITYGSAASNKTATIQGNKQSTAAVTVEAFARVQSSFPAV